jgi:hypothetical protein
MKDMPALLCAVLSVKDRELLARVFPRVIDNAKMLRNFVQIVRSGAVGRKSLGSAPKRLVREWLDARDAATLFKANVGQDPSVTDIVKMVHPKPKDAAREALFGYFIGRVLVTSPRLPGCAERAAYLALWNGTLQEDLRICEKAQRVVVDVTEGFSFAYLKELYLSSMMQWISMSSGQPMEEVIWKQAALLRTQMTGAGALEGSHTDSPTEAKAAKAS